jgi:cytochrome subunit of sulfide dehydrogenase
LQAAAPRAALLEAIHPENDVVTAKLIGAVCVFALLASGAAPAPAQEEARARGLAATCFTCHGNDGHSVGGVPSALAGRNGMELLRILKDFRAGTRAATVMHQLARGYTDEQLELIAAYFAGVKPGPAAPAPAARPRF